LSFFPTNKHVCARSRLCHILILYPMAAMRRNVQLCLWAFLSEVGQCYSVCYSRLSVQAVTGCWLDKECTVYCL